MNVTLVRAWPDRHELLQLTVPAGSTLGDALNAAGWTVGADESFGIWGKAQPLDKVLREADRVEVYRPLVADPKTARRTRAAR